MSPDEDQTLSHLMKAARASEAYRVHTFRLTRERRPAGETRTVIVTVLDAGPADPARWHVSAVDDQGLAAHGNPAPQLEVAISLLHWYELDC